MARIKKNLEKSKTPELVESCQTCGKRLGSRKDRIVGWLTLFSSEDSCHCSTPTGDMSKGETETPGAIADQSKAAPLIDQQPKQAGDGGRKQTKSASPPRARSAPRNYALWLTVVLLSLVALYLVNASLRHSQLLDRLQHGAGNSVSGSVVDEEARSLVARARSLNSGAFAGWRADDFTPHSLQHAAGVLLEANQLTQAELLYRRAYMLAQQNPKTYFLEGRPIPASDNVKMATVTYLPPLIGCLMKEGKLKQAASLKADWESVVNELPFPPAARERWRLEAVKAWGNQSDREKQLKAVVTACEEANHMTPADFSTALNKNTEESRKVDAHGISFGMTSMPRAAYDVDRALDDLAQWYGQQKEYAKQEQVLRQRADLQGKIYAPGDWLSHIWQDIARCCDRQGKYADATAAIRKAIDCLQAASFDQHDFGGCLRNAYRDYASYLLKDHKPEEAHAASLRADELQKVYR